MSHRVTFIIQDQPSGLTRIAFLCQLIEKWYRARQPSCFCLTPDTDYSEQLDTQLWEYNPESFIPHTIGKVSTDTNQIFLSHQLTDSQGAKTLFNCTTTALTQFLPDCEHIEFGISADKDRLRGLYKAYQQQKLELSFIRI
tara:strand:- start:121 stop:543 length:423 start_codon:yes stop_codon:yes gene_type:complete